ncbi:MAG: hypothetical protein ACT4QA_12730 [Panacagrimonas sp.]
MSWEIAMTRFGAIVAVVALAQAGVGRSLSAENGPDRYFGHIEVPLYVQGAITPPCEVGNAGLIFAVNWLPSGDVITPTGSGTMGPGAMVPTMKSTTEKGNRDPRFFFGIEYSL